MAHRGTRKRGGRSDRMANRLRGQDLKSVRAADMNRYRDRSCMIGGLDGAAKYHNESVISETVEEHIIPRQSVSKKQLLNINPLPSERVVLNGQQLLHIEDAKGNLVPQFDPQGNPIMVPITETKPIGKAIKTLLATGNRFAQARDINRLTHYDKRIVGDSQEVEPFKKENEAEIAITLHPEDVIE